MLRGMTLTEFRRWRAYYALDPFGQDRQDYRIASLVSTFVNVFRRRGSKKFTIEDALLPFGEKKKKKEAKSWQHLKAMGRMIAGKTKK